jgi:multidrug efflux pump subunit AcrA (membrane-fusion protein)
MDAIQELDYGPSRRIAAVPIYVIAVLVVAGIAALIWLRIDRVVAGRGVLVPPDHSIKVAALRAGVVERVLVREGQLVQAGQPLMVLDDREDAAAVAALEAQAAATRREIEERERLIARRRELADAERDLVARERQSEAVGIDALRAESQRLARETARLETVLARKTVLFNEKAASLSELEEARLARDGSLTREAQNSTAIAQKEMLLEQLDRKAEQAAAAAAVETQREELAQHEGRRNLAVLERQLADARLRLARATITAPATGTVHALAVRGKGEFVVESNVVCRLTPPDTGLMAEVELSAADVGFIKKGQRTKIKLDAFPFEDYGALTGRVEYVATDAEPADEASSKRLPVYTVRVRIDGESFARRHREKLEFRPGMTLTAELVERRESLAAALFRPLRKASREVEAPQ